MQALFTILALAPIIVGTIIGWQRERRYRSRHPWRPDTGFGAYLRRTVATALTFAGQAAGIAAEVTAFAALGYPNQPLTHRLVVAVMFLIVSLVCWIVAGIFFSALCREIGATFAEIGRDIASGFRQVRDAIRSTFNKKHP